MQVVYDLKDWAFEGQGIVTIGTFDGVHLGHRKLLRRLNELRKQRGGKSIVFTFDPHPRKVLFPNQTDLQLITSLNEKIELLQELDIDYTVVYPFSAEFSQIEPDKFIKEILVDKLKVKTLVIGYDHRFGRNRSGNIGSFKTAAPVYGFEVEEIAAEDVNDINVSSTRIRKALFEGEVAAAASFLGYNYFLSGEVVHGKKLGRTIGYPTANIRVKDPVKLIPKMGVYLVGVEVDDFKGFGMMNIGTNPTTDTDNNLKLEVNMFNFDRDIYTRTLKVEFIERIRDEKKFDALDELIAEIKNDERICKGKVK
ncbi:MAG: bifunctional riboflavin kinase/FAD synthetase [Bacteroidia bacterium]